MNMIQPLLMCNHPLAQKQNVPVNFLGFFVAEVARVIFLFLAQLSPALSARKSH